eukprot:10591413-Alexandrium_andersonii.AAC.1
MWHVGTDAAADAASLIAPGPLGPCGCPLSSTHCVAGPPAGSAYGCCEFTCIMAPCHSACCIPLRCGLGCCWPLCL